MAKSKLGLQKEVSKIFTGIQIPKKDIAVAGPDVNSAASPSTTIPHAQVPPAQVSEPVTVVAQVISPLPVVTPVKTASPKPEVVSPKPFAIPEPPTQTTSQPTRQVIYEPPQPRQTVFESPASGSVPVSAPAKQPKSEFVIKQHKDSPLLKIIEKVKAKLLTSKQGDAASGRQKIIILLSSVLVIVFLLVIMSAVKTSPAVSPASSVKPSNKATSSGDGKINWEIPQPLPADLRNPMVFGSVSASGSGATGGLVVKGIVYSSDNPCAIIDELIVHAGDTIAGATVVKINPDSVDFAMGDKKWSQKVER